jgi:Flp pilus assembly pilin Flp
MNPKKTNRSLSRQRGASMVDYALLVAMITLTAYAAANALGNRVKAEMTAPQACLAGSIACGTPGNGGPSGG